MAPLARSCTQCSSSSLPPEPLFSHGYLHVLVPLALGIDLIHPHEIALKESADPFSPEEQAPATLQ